MHKLILLLTATFLFTGCGKLQREVAGWTGDAYTTCIDGVNYLQFTSGTTVKYNPNGTISTCSEPSVLFTH